MKSDFLRLDLLLLRKQLASTRTKSQELIRSGFVSVNGKIELHPGEKFPEQSEILLHATEHPYVSRGGVKLHGALSFFGISVEGLWALDIGQSTGGFTDCLLKGGVSGVVGIEVGFNQLDKSLRSDPRVRLLEKQDIRNVSVEKMERLFSLVVVDLSFISLLLVLPSIVQFLVPGAHVLLLVKPQFEVGPEFVGSGGIVRDDAARLNAVLRVEQMATALGFTVAGKMESAIAGGDGNREHFLYLRWPSS